MQRPVSPHQRENAVDQLFALVILQIAKGYQIAQMFASVRVTPGASQRTLFGDLYRQ
jgi:hypothetical protein